MIALLLLFGFVFLYGLGAVLLASFQTRRMRREERRRFKSTIRYCEEIRRLTREVDETLERSRRRLVVTELLTGEKCRGCGERKNVREVVPVDSASGRPVNLCKECRALAGVDDDPSNSVIVED